jgi:hypothetical protein
MIFRLIIALCSENNAKFINTFRGQNEEISSNETHSILMYINCCHLDG